MSQRILIPVLFYYPDCPSGSARLAFDEAVYLAQMGHEVWMVTQDSDETHPAYAQRDGLNVLHYRSPHLSMFDPKRLTIHHHLTCEVLKQHGPTNVDVIHGHSPLQYNAALNLYKNEANCCYTVHSPVKLEMRANSRGESVAKKLYYTINAQINHRVERRCLEGSDIIISVSAYTRSLLKQQHNREIAERTQVFPGWVDTERFQIATNRDALKQRFGWRSDVPLLFTLRRLVPRNGIDRLILALHMVRSAGYSFQMIIGGTGPLLEEFQALAREYNLVDAVHLIGFVDDDNLPLMYAACDAFILPTTELECFGLITLEAFAAGRPVLATSVGAIPEVIRPLEPSWIAKDASPQMIAKIIIEYLDGYLPQHDPVALRQYVLDHYSREYVLQQITSCILSDR